MRGLSLPAHAHSMPHSMTAEGILSYLCNVPYTCTWMPVRLQCCAQAPGRQMPITDESSASASASMWHGGHASSYGLMGPRGCKVGGLLRACIASPHHHTTTPPYRAVP